MTIIVGVVCSDGIVIGADSAASFTNGRERTIEQETKKLTIIEDKIIGAGSGQIGLGQRFEAVVKKAWDDGVFTKNPVEVGKILAANAIQDFVSTSAPTGQYGAFVAFPYGTSFNLCEFPRNDFQPELKTDLWYASMGSGQKIIDPFLGLMRRTFWEKGPPSHQEGKFAVTWAISHAIDVNPGGINKPMQMAVLEPTKRGQLCARLLDESEIDEHLNNVEGAIDHLRDYAAKLSGERKPSDPELPPKP